MSAGLLRDRAGKKLDALSNLHKTMRRIFISPVLERGVRRGLPFSPLSRQRHWGSSAAAWKMEETQTIEGAPR